MEFSSALPWNSKLSGGGLWTLHRKRFTPEKDPRHSLYR